jgi:protein tyrosine phosphatase (PTP) superfamily phosphohydrolase (DUF442 family)
MLLAPGLLLAALLLVGCGSNAADGAVSRGDAPATSAEATVAERDLETADRLGVRDARMPASGLLTAGQLSETQALAQDGYGSSISLRRSREDGAGWEEPYGPDRGCDVHRLPVAGARGLTRENVDAFASLLESTRGTPTGVYCGSSNRMAATMALKVYGVDGVEPARAYQMGVDAGLAGLSEAVGEMLGLDPIAPAG